MHIFDKISTLDAVNISSTFFFQLTDSTPPNFELGQVGSFGSTKQRYNVAFENKFSEA